MFLKSKLLRLSVSPRKNKVQTPKIKKRRDVRGVKCRGLLVKTSVWKLGTVKWKAALFRYWKLYIKSSCSRLHVTWRAVANRRPRRVVKLYCHVVNFHKQQRIYDPSLKGEMEGGEWRGGTEGRGQVTDRRHLTEGRGNAEFSSNFPSSAACPISHPHSSHSPTPVFT